MADTAVLELVLTNASGVAILIGSVGGFISAMAAVAISVRAANNSAEAKANSAEAKEAARGTTEIMRGVEIKIDGQLSKLLEVTERESLLRGHISGAIEERKAQAEGSTTVGVAPPSQMLQPHPMEVVVVNPDPLKVTPVKKTEP